MRRYEGPITRCGMRGAKEARGPGLQAAAPRIDSVLSGDRTILRRMTRLSDRIAAARPGPGALAAAGGFSDSAGGRRLGDLPGW
eukprot:751222-Hanusia_phi.AAC.2